MNSLLKHALRGKSRLLIVRYLRLPRNSVRCRPVGAAIRADLSCRMKPSLDLRLAAHLCNISGKTFARTDGRSHLNRDNNGLTGEYFAVPRLIPVRMVTNEAGALGILEGFDPCQPAYERFYFLTNLAPGSQRGGHAHKSLRQVFVALRGEVTVDIRTVKQLYRFRLTSHDQALVLPAGYWRDLHSFSADALIGVLASDKYDESDYIRDWNSYASWLNLRSSSSVPYLDLARSAAAIGNHIVARLKDVVFSGVLIGGPEVRQFESAFAKYCEVPHAVGVGNGLDALTLALRAENVGSGSEVILPANTFIATALAVVESGATPVLVDVEESTGLMDMAEVEMAITPRTRAIIPVHLCGHPCDMDRLACITAKRDIFVLEDAAQAHGARYKGRRCGSLGSAAAFSFYPTKNLGALGDAGCVTTGQSELASRIRLLGNYGSERKYEHTELGANSRLDPIQAAALNVKLPLLDDLNAVRTMYATTYLQELRDTPGLSLPVVHPWADPVWHVFPVRVAADQRSEFISFLAENGIGTNIHYPKPIHVQPCFESFQLGRFPVAERLAHELVSLPLDPTHTVNEINRVIDVVQRFASRHQPASISPMVKLAEAS